MRGVINVVAAQPQTLTVKVSSNSFTGIDLIHSFVFHNLLSVF